MLTVRDIMSPAVVTVSPGATVRQLARVLADGEISGAPVVNEEGTLVGVVSATDVVRFAADDTDVHVTGAARSAGSAEIPSPNFDEEPDSVNRSRSSSPAKGESSGRKNPYGSGSGSSSKLGLGVSA
ncbi:MAG: CBS domain-containing protein, partial [Gemmatimonadetes bacterium]|nr:CBS domain-containing protein [Gemmatimonadota bacterium]